MGKFGMGQSIKRIEDERFLTGSGNYTDDINISNQCWLNVVRSPFAHAEIKKIDLRSAKKANGVLGVFLNNDLESLGFSGIPYDSAPPDKSGNPVEIPHRPILAKDKVRYVGEPIAIIIAETLAQAKDAAELIEIEFNELSAFSDISSAIKSDKNPIFNNFKKNILVDWSMGDEKKADLQFKQADKIVSIDLINNRIAPTAIEPRSVIANFDKENNNFTLITGSQGSHKLKEWITGKNGKKAAEIKPEQLRVICPDVGGGFGMKNFLFNETLAVLFASKYLGRPVKWTADRSESFLSDTHGRDQVNHAELALNKEGKFLAIKVSSYGNVGAYVSQFGAMIPTLAGCGMLCGCYDMKAAFVNVKVVMTNTVPVDAYRGAGRPESAYLIERLVDKAAKEIGISPEKIRKLNFIKPNAFPYKTPLGMEYDSGEYEKIMNLAMNRANLQGFEKRRKESEKKGKLRGIGLSYYIEACGGGPTEFATMSITEDGKLLLKSGSQNNGQGHETLFSQIIADKLGLPMDSIEIRMGDTKEIKNGMGTGGSRALAAGGVGVYKTSELLIGNAKKVAAKMLEAPIDDIDFQDGDFHVAGTDIITSLTEAAKASYNKDICPEDVEPGLLTESEQIANGATFPNGCHICELEIDKETGEINFINYIIEDDIGRILNPMMLEGQILGGAGQGIGQALYEETVYNNDGQLVNGSFMDYIMPRADNLPSFDFHYTEVPSPSNMMGVKGAGEAGTIGATPAVSNAVCNALDSCGADNIDMPMTPFKIWSSIKRAEIA